jgi:hypothetical protein
MVQSVEVTDRLMHFARRDHYNYIQIHHMRSFVDFHVDLNVL